MKKDRLKIITKVAFSSFITAIMVLLVTLITVGTYKEKRLVDDKLSHVAYEAPPLKNEYIEITCKECKREYILFLDFEEKSAKLYLDAGLVKANKSYKATGKITLNADTLIKLCDSVGGVVLCINGDDWRMTGNQVFDLLHRDINGFEANLATVLRCVFAKGLQKEQIYIILEESDHINIPFSQLESIAVKSADWMAEICVVN